MKISKAKLEDVERILEIQHSAFLEESMRYNNAPMHTLTETFAEAKDAMKSAVILKAELDSKIVGAVRYEESGNVCKIGRLCVDPNYRRRGIASALLKACEEFSSPYCEIFELFTGYKSFDNQRLYESRGYIKTHEEVVRPDFIFVYMRKNRNS